MASVIQLRNIKTAHAELTEDALPLLIETQKTERELSDMFVALERAAVAPDVNDLADAKQDFQTKVGSLRNHVAQVVEAFGSSALGDRLADHLNALEASADRLLTSQNTLFAAQSEIDAHKKALNAIRIAARDNLRTLNFGTTVGIENLLSQARQDNASVTGAIDQLFSELFLTSLNLVSLSMDIESTIDLAAQDRSNSTIEESKLLAVTLKTKLRRITALLAQLESGAERAELAKLAIELDEVILADGGLVALGNATASHLSELAALRDAKLEMVTELSEFISTLTNQATLRVAEKSISLNKATQLMTTVLLLSFVGVLGAVVAGNSFIVEKQINRRMRGLERSVHAIAGGDLTHPIDVKGDDELGDIARALIIFKENAEELRRSNVDLERFAYVAAHDLRSPLRAVHDLAEWTLEDSDNQLTDESNNYLHLLQNRANRLDRLLSDLLNYARAGQENENISPVRMQDMIEQISTMLDPQNTFRIDYVGPLDSTNTLSTPLEQILINLVSNAIKHHDKSNGTVTISAKLLGDRIVVTVADDGPGILREYQDRIYNLFQTLKPRDDVEGSGLGLAIIRKLLERYKDRIELKSDPEKTRGSQFCFDLPATAVALHEVEADAA